MRKAKIGFLSAVRIGLGELPFSYKTADVFWVWITGMEEYIDRNRNSIVKKSKKSVTHRYYFYCINIFLFKSE